MFGRPDSTGLTLCELLAIQKWVNSEIAKMAASKAERNARVSPRDASDWWKYTDPSGYSTGVDKALLVDIARRVV